MSFNNYSTRAWVRYFVWLPETLIFWRKYLFQCVYLSAVFLWHGKPEFELPGSFLIPVTHARHWKKEFKTFTFVFRFPANLDKIILIVMSRQTVVFCHTTMVNKIRTFSFVFVFVFFFVFCFCFLSRPCTDNLTLIVISACCHSFSKGTKNRRFDLRFPVFVKLSYFTWAERIVECVADGTYRGLPASANLLTNPCSGTPVKIFSFVA